MAIIIDPPSGWKYGFPRVIPYWVKDVPAWLVENGYPQSEIDSCGNYFAYRIWEAEEVVVTVERVK